MKQPNLIYVFADQLRYQSLGYAGDGRARTPCIDRLAAQGVNFRQAVSCAPVCAAYRASLFTGKYTTSHGMVINELRINPNQKCLGHALTEAGYDTCYIGKWHLYANELGNHHDAKNSFVPRGPHRLGFDGEWYAYNFHHQSYGENAYYHTESPQKIHYGPGVYEADAQTEMAIDYVRRKARSDRPFAMVLSWGPPHDPWTDDNTPADLRGLFDPNDFPNPGNYKDVNDPHGDAWSRLSPRDRSELSKWRANYYAQTTSLDRNVGRLVAALDELGAAENTILVFTSDHGEMMGAQGRRAKNIFYEEACRIPFLMRWPGRIAGGSISDACLSTVDIMPTLLTMMEIEVPAGVEGMDLSRAALGRGGPEPDAALMMVCGATAAWEDGYEWRALRDQRHTYAIYRRDRAELLFDHVADPLQTTNLAAQASHAGAIARMREMLGRKMAGINDTFESCTWYRDHWTDGDRRIIRSATSDWSGMGLM